MTQLKLKVQRQLMWQKFRLYLYSVCLLLLLLTVFPEACLFPLIFNKTQVCLRVTGKRLIIKAGMKVISQNLKKPLVVCLSVWFGLLLMAIIQIGCDPNYRTETARKRGLLFCICGSTGLCGRKYLTHLNSEGTLHEFTSFFVCLL